MAFDVTGSGAAGDDFLVRPGHDWESARRLAGQAARAEKADPAKNGAPFGHGVSVTSAEANQRRARDPGDAVQATRRAFEEAGFEARYTPTDNDSDHHTVQLPSPVTDDVAARFNMILGRKRGRASP
jgi:hypothetical protein